MTARFIEMITGSLEQKKQYRQSKARIDALPEPYATVGQALHRYLLCYGGFTQGEPLVTMFGDLADLWERAAVDGTPVIDILGDDPVEFAETFARAYAGKEWIDRERERLVRSIGDAVRPDGAGR